MTPTGGEEEFRTYRVEYKINLEPKAAEKKYQDCPERAGGNGSPERSNEENGRREKGRSEMDGRGRQAKCEMRGKERV